MWHVFNEARQESYAHRGSVKRDDAACAGNYNISDFVTDSYVHAAAGAGCAKT
jgi:hypothetical protein